MADLYSIISALRDSNRINETEFTELMGSNSRPQYQDVLGCLVDKNFITKEESATLKYPDPNRLMEILQSRGVL